MSDPKKPLRRHAGLAPLSRDHHHILILAQLLKENAPVYRGLPDTTAGKRTYALTFHHNSLQGHLHREEETLLPMITGRSATLDALGQALLEEHRAIEQSFVQLTRCPEEEWGWRMHDLGLLLERHVRREEREWFPAIQEHLTEEELTALEPLLNQ